MEFKDNIMLPFFREVKCHYCIFDIRYNVLIYPYFYASAA